MGTELNDGHETAHRIEITLNGRRCRVIHQGVTYADTHASLTLIETGRRKRALFPARRREHGAPGTLHPHHALPDQGRRPRTIIC